MRALTRLSAMAGVLAVALGGPVANSVASAHHGPVVGHIYIDDNTAPVNTIAAYDRHPDGSLTAVPGSPFATGGAGTGHGIGSQGALQTARHGRYLVAVDAGSNQISVMQISRDGSLRLLPGGVVSSNGAEPVSVTVHHRLVYVANAGAGASNYTGLRFGRHGQLSPVPGSTVSLSDAAAPGDVLVNSTGTNLAGLEVGTSLIDSFAVGDDGRLTPAAGSPFSAQGPGPFGSEFRPTDPRQLFVSNAHGGAGNGSVSAFRVTRDGTLSSIGSSPFADHQTAPCWVEISHDGRFLFTVNTASASVSSYEIAPSGSLTLLGSTPLQGPSGLGPEDARLSPDGRTLWVVDTAGDQLSAFAVRGGHLTELPTSPSALPPGAAPFGIVVN
jgi:6-phosphogluconolactonase